MFAATCVGADAGTCARIAALACDAVVTGAVAGALLATATGALAAGTVVRVSAAAARLATGADVLPAGLVA